MRLDGTKVLLSGEFEGYTRDQLAAELRARGAVIVERMAMDIEIVFAGDRPSSDVDAAMELGVRVEEADALRAALQGAAAPPKKPIAEPIGAPPSDDVAPHEDWADSTVAPDGQKSAKPQGRKGDKPAQQGRKADKPAPQKEGKPAEARQFERGARVRIIGGREGVGEVGEIFWWGDSKFGEGMRAGVTADSGEKFWVDEAHLAWPDADVDEEAVEEAKAANQFGRGDRVQITSGKGAGTFGTIFWWGESKWGDGMRAGVETDAGEKLWVDAGQIAPADDDGDEDSSIPF